MSLRRFGVGQGTIAALIAGSLLLANACSGDSGDVNFDPIDGGDSGASAGGTKLGTAGGQGMTAGKNAGGGGNQAGAGSRGGSAGTSNGGTDSGGTDTGGTDMGGTDTGGKDTGGTDTGGTDTGGKDTGGTDTGGTDTGGTDTGGTDTGGTDTGGTDTGGTDTGGTDTGGTAGMGGKDTGGTAGMGGKDTGGSAGMGGKDTGGSGGGPSCTPTTEICDGVDNDCDKGIDQGNTCPAGCTGATYGGHTYVFCGKVATAVLAGTKCQDLKLGVVIIGSEAENTFVVGKVKGSSWLGASDQTQEKRWIWAQTGEVFWNNGAIDGKYNNWGKDQPNNNGAMGASENCAVISTAAATKGQWNDVDCLSPDISVACESLDPVP